MKCGKRPLEASGRSWSVNKMIYYRVPIFRLTLALRVVSAAEPNEQLFSRFITLFSAAFSNYNSHCSSRSVSDTVDSRVADNLFIRNL
ncbi:hypothetical protein CDAR_574671 [Caerostris darwini]|uniref:Uncharacterized protein n=1 Tax=Caerostris darwini TaxID=1538125 RepID=A0AAV4QF94_9ARAC|nr:hypothetical protein CDAR_574671 [Caerostris darwini]